MASAANLAIEDHAARIEAVDRCRDLIVVTDSERAVTGFVEERGYQLAKRYIVLDQEHSRPRWWRFDLRIQLPSPANRLVADSDGFQRSRQMAALRFRHNSRMNGTLLRGWNPPGLNYPAPRSRACLASASASWVMRKSAASRRFAQSA